MNELLPIGENALSDSLVSILFALFVASTVNERIIDFIKLRLPVLWLKSVNQREELKRHQRLWILAFGMGIVTATLVDINLLVFLTENYNGKKFTDFLNLLLKSDYAWVGTFFGYVFTALFLSLGSKFWHDLLDLVLFIKNGKRKIEDFNPVGVTDMKQVMEFYHANVYEIACKALEANRKELEEEFQHATFAVGYEHHEKEYRLCITVLERKRKGGVSQDLSDKPLEKPEGFRRKISFIEANGYVFHFPIMVLRPGQVRIVDSQVLAGGGLFNTAARNNVGTFGCVVKEKSKCEDLLLLTCYHCVKAPGHSWAKFDPNHPQKNVQYMSSLEDKSPIIAGEIVAGQRHNRMDIAIIKPQNKGDISDYRWFPHMTVPLGSREVNLGDVEKHTEIWFSGITSGNSKGYIINIGISAEINYSKEIGKEELHTIEGLIIFSKTATPKYKAPCDEGDSGAVILDAKTHLALGMIVAKDEYFGYAIPMSDILRINSLALFNDPCNSNSSSTS